MNNYIFSLVTKKRIFFSFFILIIGLLFYGFYNRAYIKIELPVETARTYLSIKNQSTEKILKVSTKSSTYKRLLTPGIYEVTVINNGQSYFKAIKVGRFFSTTSVVAKYTNENTRSFIGDNPKSCLEIIKGVLISAGCSGPLDSLSVHEPATDNTPTFVAKFRSESNLGDIEGMIKDDKGVVVILVKKGLGGLNYERSQTFYKINVNNNRLALSFLKKADLDTTKTYTMKKYGSSIVIADNTFKEVYTGKNIAKLSKPTNIPQAKDSSLLLTSVSYSGDSVLATYEKTRPDLTSTRKLKEKSEIAIKRDSKVDKTFKESFVKVDFCNDDICALTYDGQLKILDSNLNYKYELTNVKDFFVSNKTILIVNKQGVLEFNLENQSGFYSYTFGQYIYEGLKVQKSDKYILRVRNSKRSFALLVDEKTNEKDFIDKKLTTLFENSYVDTISVYGNHIFISPNLGKLTYNQSTGRLGYAQSTKDKASSSINKAIADSKIDRSKYKLVISGL